MNDISIIIVNYNTKDLLKNCLHNLLSFKLKFQIIVVDNGSIDGSSDLIESVFFDDVTLIKSENKGLSYGYNLGLEKSDGKYVIFLGTDAYPEKQALEKLIMFMEENTDVGICTPRLVLRDGTADMDAHRGFSTPWTSLSHWLFLDRIFPNSTFFNGYFMGYKNIYCRHEIDVCISHFMLVRREVFDKVGKWDESFFLYGEDIDMCYRVKEAGYRIMYLGDIEVLHYKGAGVGRKTSKGIQNISQKSEIVKKILATGRTQAMKTFYKKHLEKKYPFILNEIVYLGIWLLEKARTVSVYFKK